MTAEKPAPVSDYDEFVDWTKRLEREVPFFRRVFDEAGVRSVIDVGAGSARLAIEYAAAGLDVVAVDPDESMLEQARRNVERFADRVAEAGGSIRVLPGGFGGLAGLGLGPADALTCTGNALPHVAGRAGLREALADFSAVIRPGGVLVLHLLNHERLLSKKIRSMPPKVVDTEQGTKVFLRVIDYPSDGESLDFDFVTLLRDATGEWTLSSRRSAHTALPITLLSEALDAAGFDDVRALGGHDGRALADEDESVIVVARRR
jgi:SAM-dependent methyltransferase